MYFGVVSHGYEFAADGFGMRGTSIELTPGGEATLKIKRVNLAERLYRVTGEGIYAESAKLGKPAPIGEPLLNGQVTGQDSVLNAIYRGKLWWFWGDTGRQSYPLGHFSTAGATSDLPGQGGLDPAVGVNLKYFVGKDGFSRPMVPPTGAELHWIDGLVVVKDDKGQERMVTTVTKLKDLGKVVGREMMVFNDEKGTFETLKPIDLKSNGYLCGHPFRHSDGGTEYFYFGQNIPNRRVKADWSHLTDPATYEAFTDGKWETNSSPKEATPHLKDVDSKRSVEAHYGSVRWNEFLHKWVMIVVERGGKSSFLGEVWFAVAPAPEGPWTDARKVLTHARYSFYNPVQHEFFGEPNGKYLYFEGTYSTTFSRDDDPTPRYDYNQMMYRLDLSDERLK